MKIPRAVSGARKIHSLEAAPDTDVLLPFLSFLSPCDKIPLDLFKGALPRKRWTVQGGVEDVDAARMGLDPTLLGLLSDRSRLRNCLSELHSSSSISEHDSEAIGLERDVVDRLRKGLSVEDADLWKVQALLVSYRAIPWKYLEPV